MCRYKRLQLEYQMKKFQTWLDTEKIICKLSYAFPPYITPAKAISSIPNSLYEEERKGFVISGYINQYPDFIVIL